MIITLTTDFDKQSHGVGMMEAVIAAIVPNGRVIHYAHGLTDYSTTSVARVLETVQYIEPAIHVCVCDPGVGTSRRPLALHAQRGDILIGPDNGVLLPAAAALRGIVEARETTNRDLMRVPVSPVFHGRDLFCPVAAHLAAGVEFSHSATRSTSLPSRRRPTPTPSTSTGAGGRASSSSTSSVMRT